MDNFVNSMSEVLHLVLGCPAHVASRATRVAMGVLSKEILTKHPKLPKFSPSRPRKLTPPPTFPLTLPCPRIAGMDFYLVLERPGKRVARRKRCNNKVGTCHQVTKEDAMKWFQQKYDGIILTK